MAYRFHRHGDKRVERLEVEVSWTPSFQSYYSVGDESEPYCSNCDEELEDGWYYCPGCGSKLVTIRNCDQGSWKENGVR